MTRPLCPLAHTDSSGEPTEKPRAAGLAVCWSHRNRLERLIRQLPELYFELEPMLHPDGPPLKPYTTGSANSARLNEKTGEEEEAAFVSSEVAAIRDRILATLHGWARVVAEDNKLTGPGTLHPTVVSQWLVAHIDMLANDADQVEEATKWMREVVRDAWSLAYPSGRRRFPVRGIDGTCVRCLEVTRCDVETREELRCDGRLRADLARDDDPLERESEIRCSFCGTTYAASQWLTLGRRIHREAS